VRCCPWLGCRDWPAPLLRREAVERTGTAGTLERRLAAATARSVRRLPGLRRRVVPQSHSVVMAQHGRPLGSAPGPVAACHVVGADEGRAVGLRAGQHVVHVRRVAPAVDLLPLFGQGRCLGQVVLPVQFRDVVGDHHAQRVPPRPGADPVACADRRLAIGRLRAEIGAPGPARVDRFCQLLAMRVGSSEAAQIGAVARADALGIRAIAIAVTAISARVPLTAASLCSSDAWTN